MQRVDAVVVGGGAAGLIAAREAARLGLEVVLFEEDPVIGRPERCAGLYSVSGLRKLGIPINGRYLQNLISGAVIYSPRGRCFEVRTEGPVAVVANREVFDRALAEGAVEAGAKVLSNSRVSSAIRNSKGVKLIVNRGDRIEARVLIDAEGHGGFIARQLYPRYRSDGWIPIIQLLIKNHGMEKERAYVWFKPYLRDFFGYLVPINEELGKVGVAARRDTLDKAMRFVKETFPGSKVIGYSSSSVYSGLPINVGLTGNAILVGDVAGQVKATTGGGIVIGGMCAIKAAKHASALVGEGKADTYMTEVKQIYYQLKMIYYINKWLRRLSDEQLDQLIGAIDESGYTKRLAKVGDMDFQASGLLKSLFSLSALRLALGALSIIL